MAGTEGTGRVSYRLNVSAKGVHVDEEIDAGVGKGLHAAVVVRGSVNMIHPDRIGTKLLHEAGVQLALVAVDEGVLRPELVRNTCCGQRHMTRRRGLSTNL